MKILNLEQGSPEWKDERRKWVTASEMASVLKIPGAYKSRKKLIEEKLGPEPELTEFQRDLFARGHMAESGLTKDAENMLGMPFQTLVAVDEELGILASIDNINLEYGVIVETKLCGTEKKLGPAREGIVWEPYRVQILTQMMVANVKIGFMLMLNADTEETHLVSVSRDPVVEQRIVDETALFNKELKAAQVGAGLKTIIAGSRDITDHGEVSRAIRECGFKVSEVVSGRAQGVDSIGEALARLHGMAVKEFPADWNKHGKAAGPIRNREMAQYAEALIAVWDGKSSGTKNMIEEMKKLGKRVYVHTVTNPNADL